MTTTLPEKTVYALVEKMNIEPCPYCRTDIDVESIPVDKFTTLTILHNTMMIVMTVERLVGVSEVKINYCPMCGRKLEDV